MKLSIIICVYNTPHRYLEDSILSVKRSTLALADYEICIVDDGSELDYSELVSRYDIKYTRHENQGILHSRLRGIEMAEGEYIAFVDSDDTVSVNFHCPMVDEANGADIVAGDWAFHTDKCKYVCVSDKLISEELYISGRGVLPFFLSEEGRQHSLFVLWNKVFKREVLLKAKEELAPIARKYPRYNYSEDALISFFAFKHAESFKNIHTGYYFYRIHTGQSVSVENKERLTLHIDCMSRTLDIMYDDVGAREDKKYLRDKIDSWRALMSRTHYSYSRAGGYTDLYPYIKEKYKVSELKRSTLDDGRYYARTRVLPKNLEKIDLAIWQAFSSDTPSVIKRDGLDSYAEKTLSYIKDRGGNIEFSDTPNTVIPKEKCNVMQTIVHNYAVSQLGLVLFPKGSKIRAFLKKHL